MDSELDGLSFRIGRLYIPNWTELLIRIGRGSMRERTTQPRLLQRHAEVSVREALSDTRIVAQIGPRQSGKTTLSALATPLGVDSKTVDRWLTLLEQMFVVRRVRAWHQNRLKRLVRTSKLHFLDTGLLAALRGDGVKDLRADRNKLGSLLEGFVYAELAKFAGQASMYGSIRHYRDKDKIGVDFVVEQAVRHAGQPVVGVMPGERSVVP